MNLISRVTSSVTRSAQRGIATVKHLHMLCIVALLSLLASPAFAATPPSTFDESAISDKITAYVLIGVGLAGAWILGLWTLRVMGFLKPKG